MEGLKISDNNDDLVNHLLQRKMVHITDKIFQGLDFQSLSNAEQASVVWAGAIEEGKVWQKLFNKNVLQSLDWKTLMNSLDIHMLGVLTNKKDVIDHHEYKKACFLIGAKLLGLEENWKNNTTRMERKCSIVEPCRAYGNGFGWMANTYRPTCNRSLAFNSRWAITAGKDSKITIRNRFNIDEIVRELNIPIDDAGRRPKISTVLANEKFIVVCFYFHSEVCVWDAATQNLLFVLDANMFGEDWDPIHSSLHQICLHDNALLTMHGGGLDVICTMYELSTDPSVEPSISFTQNLAVKAVEAVFMDETYICFDVQVNSTRMNVFGGVALDHRIETRSTSSFEFISEIDPQKYFREAPIMHYVGGVITVGYCSAIWVDSLKLRIFYAKTGACIRTVDNAQDYMADLKMIKDKYIVTCNAEGRLNVYDLKKILNRNESDGFLLNCSMEPTPPLVDYSGCNFDGMRIEADEYQVGLIGTFSRNKYSLYIRDFIGKWESEEQE